MQQESEKWKSRTPEQIRPSIFGEMEYTQGFVDFYITPITHLVEI